MQWLVLLAVSLVWTALASAEVGSRFDGEHYTDEELAEACHAFSSVTTIAYMVRSILPPNATEEEGVELMTRMMESDEVREEFGDEYSEWVMTDPFFDEGVELAVQMAWATAHQDDYELTDDEKRQDFAEFQEDMEWRCENEIAAGG